MAAKDDIRDFLINRRARIRPEQAGLPIYEHGKALNDCIALLRTEAGRAPDDRERSDLVGERSTRSEDFRPRWAAMWPGTC